jgi:hypothetical protein
MHISPQRMRKRSLRASFTLHSRLCLFFSSYFACEWPKMSPNLIYQKFKSLKAHSEINETPSRFSLSDKIVPRWLRASLMSENSQDTYQPQPIDGKGDEKEEEVTHVDRVANGNDDGSSSEEEPELWQTASMCPNDCNCGSCPIDIKDDITVGSSSNSSSSCMSLMPNVSSISLGEQSKHNNALLSITYVVPLRNYGAIIHWNVMHRHGIRGYKVYLDGNLVSSVHSPTRTSALIDSVNMSYPHHFAVTVVPNVGEQLPKIFFHRNMQAIHIYRPNHFIH